MGGHPLTGSQVVCPSAQKDMLAHVLSHLTEAISLGQRRSEQLPFSNKTTTLQLTISKQVGDKTLSYRLT